jgi:type VI secretion system secreted protein VgrG
MADPIQLGCSCSIDGQDVQVLWLEAREALDEISAVRCEVTDSEGGPDPAQVIGKKVTITLERADGSQAHKLAGYVVEAEATTPRGDDAVERGTRLVIRPRLFKLTQRTDCRTFQDVTAPDIVKRVLAGAGLADGGQQWRLTGSYPKRTYTTQYRETDDAFVRRILSEEGIACAVDGSSGTDVVVFFDTDRGDLEGDKKIPFGVGDGLRADRDAIGGFSQEKSTVPGKVHLRDYDFERPRLGLDAKVEGDDPAEKALEVYDYPGRFTDPQVGDRYAKVMLDALRARRELVRGVTSSLRLRPGQKFELDGHPYAPLNREYLVLGVDVVYEARRHSAGRADQRRGTGITFQAIPTEKTTYRPPRVPRAVSAPGAQVAVTTGASGKEIHPDEHGRVKVIFPWDRLGKPDDSSSLWIRTSQLPLGGAMLTPRVGWEVYLNFTDGDPDLPFVFGRMYNATTPPPYALPKNKTRMSIQTATTPGGGSTNEIRMEDKAGSEEMFMNASKDATVSAGNNATETVGNNETRSIGATQSLAVTDSMAAKIGANQLYAVSGNQSVHVSTFMVDDVGSHSLSIGGGRDVKAGGDHKRTVTGASTLTVGGMQVDLVAGSVDEKGLATLDEKIGAALIDLTAANHTVMVKGARTENAGAVKVILAGAGRAVQIGASLKQKVAGAILTKIKADRADESAGDFLEIAAGAQLIKADNVVFEASDLLSVVMGASTITLTPASVSIAGVKITIDGECDEMAAIVKDN